MKIDRLIVSTVMVAMLSLQAWTLNQVVTLGQKIAVLEQRLTDYHDHHVTASK